MQVQSVNNNQTISFNGYVSRKATQYINFLERRFMSGIDFSYEPVTMEDRRIHNFLKRDACYVSKSCNNLRSALNEFMSKLHPNTRFTVVIPKGHELGDFQISNPITKKVLNFTQEYASKEHYIGTIQKHRIAVREPVICDRWGFADWARDINRINPAEVDRIFYDDAIDELKDKASKANNWFKKQMLKRYITKIIKYKEKCNIDSPETKETLLKKVNDAFSKLQTKEI